MLEYIYHISLEILPVFLVAVFFSSLIDHFLPDDFFQKTLNQSNEFLAIAFSAVVGSLVPICTCGMIPLVIGLNKKGLNWKLLAAFLTAGNANSIPAMLLTATLSWDFVLWRFIVSVLFGMLTAYGLAFFVREDYSITLEMGCCGHDHGDCCHKPKFFQKFIADLKELCFSFLPWIFLAIILAALMHQSLADGSLSMGCCFGNVIAPFKDSFLAPFLTAVIGFPFYFCAGADVPLAKELLLIPLGFGSVITFMLAAPGINLTSFLVYKKAIGIKAATIYLLTSILVISILGVIVNLIL